MAFGYDNKDTRSILNAARANQDILKEQPGPAGYVSGSPRKPTDPEFHKTEMAGRGLGLEGEFFIIFCFLIFLLDLFGSFCFMFYLTERIACHTDVAPTTFATP